MDSSSTPARPSLAARLGLECCEKYERGEELYLSLSKLMAWWLAGLDWCGYPFFNPNSKLFIKR